MALKHRRSSTVGRMGIPLSSYDNLKRSSTSALRVSSVGVDEAYQNDSSFIPSIDTKLASTEQKTSRAESINDSNPVMKPNRSNSTKQKVTLSNEKTSTTCTIQ